MGLSYSSDLGGPTCHSRAFFGTAVLCQPALHHSPVDWTHKASSETLANTLTKRSVCPEQMDIKGEQSAEGAVQSSNGHVRLTEAALKEALACPAGQATKPFIAALLKLANGLSLEGASQVSTASPTGCNPGQRFGNSITALILNIGLRLGTRVQYWLWNVHILTVCISGTASCMKGK